MPTPNAFKVTVTEIYDLVQITTPDDRSASTSFGRDVFSQSFPVAEFDMQAMVLALNRRRRNRKARGKEVAS